MRSVDDFKPITALINEHISCVVCKGCEVREPFSNDPHMQMIRMPSQRRLMESFLDVRLRKAAAEVRIQP